MPNPPAGRGAQRPRRRAATRGLVAATASAALNAALLAALHSAGAFTLPRTVSATQVGLAAVAPERWRANRALAAPDAAGAEPPAAPAAPLPEAPPRPEPDPRGEVVAAPPSPDRRAPRRWRFLSDRDGAAPRDVQSREAGKRRSEATLARPTPGAEGPQGIPERGEEGRAREPAPGREGAPREDALERARLARPPSPRGEAAPGASPRGRGPASGPPGEGGARRAGRYDPRLLPTAATFQRLAGGAGERLADVEEGDETSLNTRRFRFAEFFLRVKSAVAREWDPNGAMDARDPAAQRYGRATRGATVDIVLAPAGEVREVRLVRSSGLEFYDREVVRAIRAASPFPNPPRELVGRDGRILLARWRFELAWDGVRPRFALPGGQAAR